MPLLSATSVFDVEGLSIPDNIQGLMFFGDEGSEEIYEPSAIKERLGKVGCTSVELVGASTSVEMTELARKLIVKIEKFTRIVQSTRFFSEEDFRNRNSSLHADFGAVMKLLEKHSLISEVKRSISGTRKLFCLTCLPEDLLLGQTGHFSSRAIKRFWEDVRSS